MTTLSKVEFNRAELFRGVLSRTKFSREPIDTGASCPKPSRAVSYCSGPIYRTT